MRLGHTTAPRRPGHLCVAKMIDALMEGPQTVADLIDASGLSAATVRGYILTMRKENVLRIAEWEEDARGRLTRPAYVLGSGRNAVKVAPMARKDVVSKYRERNRQRRLLDAISEPILLKAA